MHLLLLCQLAPLLDLILLTWAKKQELVIRLNIIIVLDLLEMDPGLPQQWERSPALMPDRLVGVGQHLLLLLPLIFRAIIFLFQRDRPVQLVQSGQ